MENGLTYKKAHFQELAAEMSQLFDVVRLVDPISTTAYTIEDGEFHAQPDNCFHVWNRTARCENCVSSRCFMERERYSKFEFINNDIYHVVAQPVEVDGKRYVLEVVTASNDNVLLSAFGNNEFVDRVTTFNRKMYTDDLTGLSNRRYLDERLNILINRSVLDGTPLSVVMLDIDDFKDINDGLGHHAGDKVLSRVAEVLREALAPTTEDILARYGGDEFIAALRNVSRAELERRLRSIPPIEVDEGMRVTLSVGAFYQEKVEILDTQVLIQRADRAMYDAKATGKNSFEVEE